MLPTKFRFIWQSDFRIEDFLEINHSETRIFCNIYGRSSIKVAHFVPIRLQTLPPQVILVSDWLISKKSSPLKLLGQMNRNLVGSIYGRSSINIAHLVLIR
jgi:hypothetical protein